MPDEVEVPPDELVEPPDEEPDEDVDPPDEVEPPDEDVEPPDDEVELLPPLVLLDELVLGPGSVPVAGGAGSVPFVVDARSDEGVPKRSLSFAPPQAARRATEDAIAALMKRRVFMRVAKH
jgi:hypothetical protein